VDLCWELGNFSKENSKIVRQSSVGFLGDFLFLSLAKEGFLPNERRHICEGGGGVIGRKKTTAHVVDECSYVRHSSAYKPVRCGSLQLCESFSQLTNMRENP
jgi:hypothetical protein